MAKTSAVLERLKHSSIPYISVLTDPVYGGVSASLAMLGDINIAEPNARAGFARPNIIEQTIRQKLPKGFQRSEFLLERGAIDMIVTRQDMRSTISTNYLNYAITIRMILTHLLIMMTYKQENILLLIRSDIFY